MKDILIFGAGGQAKNMVNAIEKSKDYNIVGLIDDTENPIPSLMGFPVYNDVQVLYLKGIKDGIVAVGDNAERYRIVDNLLKRYPDFSFVTVVHPAAQMARNTCVKEGSVIMAGCCLGPFTEIGRHCIVNTSAIIGHDGKIGDFSSVAPGAVLGGHVIVGKFTAVGLGASLIQDIEIGENTLIGAGSTVLKNITSNVVAYGVPCVVVRGHKFGTRYL